MSASAHSYYASRRGSLFLTLFCSVFMIVGLFSMYGLIDMSLRYVETEGVVVERQYNMYKIQFIERRTGRQITVSLGLGGAQSHSVGQRVTVLYDPQNPEKVVVKDPIIYLISIALAGIGGVCTFLASRPLVRSFFKKPQSYPVVEYGSRELPSNLRQPPRLLPVDHGCPKLSSVGRGFLVLTGIVCFLAAYGIYTSIGQFLDKLVLTVMFTLLGFLTVLLAGKGRSLSGRSSKRSLVSGLLVFVGLFLLVFLFILPSGLDDQTFYGRALRTDALVTGVLSTYDSDEGTLYKLNVKFTDQNTGKQVTTTTYVWEGISHPVGSQVPILYDPQAPTKARVDTGYRPSWQSFVVIPAAMSAFIMNFLIAGHILSVLRGDNNSSETPTSPSMRNSDMNST